MNKQDVINIVSGIGVLLIIGLVIPRVIDSSNSVDEPFFSMAVLNNERRVGAYFLNSSNVEVDEEHSWNILLENKGNNIEGASIRIKLVNNPDQVSDQLDCQPSQATVIFQKTLILSPNQETVLPLSWVILGYEDEVLSLQIDNIETSLGVDLNQSKNLTMIFELWIFDRSQQDYVFKWQSRGEYHCIWNKISFILNI